jgi:hypothetical protein
MRGLRWRIADLLAVTLLAAIALAAYRVYWDSRTWTGRFLFSTYLAVLTTTSIAAYFAPIRRRSLCLGYTSFGWLYLVCVLYGGFGLERASEVEFLGEKSVMGMVFGLMCAIAARLFVRLEDDRK